MAHIEYKKDLATFIELYEGLIARYRKLEENGRHDLIFEMEHISATNSTPKLFIRNHSTDIVRIASVAMSRALDSLVKMEAELNKLGMKK